MAPITIQNEYIMQESQNKINSGTIPIDICSKTLALSSSCKTLYLLNRHTFNAEISYKKSGRKQIFGLYLIFRLFGLFTLRNESKWKTQNTYYHSYFFNEKSSQKLPHHMNKKQKTSKNVIWFFFSKIHLDFLADLKWYICSYLRKIT